MNPQSINTAIVAFLCAFATASFAGDSAQDKKTGAAQPAAESSIEKLVAAEKPAAPAASTKAAQEKKLVLPNASDYVKEGVACGTAN